MRDREKEREREREYLPECLLDKPQHVDHLCLSLWSLLSQTEKINHPEPYVVTKLRKPMAIKTKESVLKYMYMYANFYRGRYSCTVELLYKDTPEMGTPL